MATGICKSMSTGCKWAGLAAHLTTKHAHYVCCHKKELSCTFCSTVCLTLLKTPRIRTFAELQQLKQQQLTTILFFEDAYQSGGKV